MCSLELTLLLLAESVGSLLLAVFRYFRQKRHTWEGVDGCTHRNNINAYTMNGLDNCNKELSSFWIMFIGLLSLLGYS